MGKSKLLTALIAVFGLFLGGGALLGIYVVGVYNGLVASEEGVKQSWSQVENVYQRRFDLIPNLVETVRGYAIHERETFEAVTEARAKVGQINIKADQLSPSALSKFQAAQGELSSALSRLMVVVERYPDLKANEQFRALMDELAGTENRIAVERKRYNETAQGFNTKIRRFPGNLVANLFGFKTYPYFEAEDGAEKAPKVDFGNLRKGETR